MYKKIHISNNGDFYFLEAGEDESNFPFEYKKNTFDFLIDAYNSNLETCRLKFAKELFNQTYESKILADKLNMKYELITREEAYEQIKNFMFLSNEDYNFVRNFMYLMTSDDFTSKKIVDTLRTHMSDTPIKTELDYLNTNLSDISQRLGILCFIIKYGWAPYVDCFTRKIYDCIQALSKYNLNEKLSFNTRVETNNNVFNRSFGYTFDTMMDAVLFDIYCFINNNASIKQCKNCGKLFLPLRSDALYCDNISPQEEAKTCKEYGAYQQWIKNMQSDEATKLYRKIYMRKQMQVKRNPDIKSYTDDFDKYKKETAKWKEQIKKGRKTSEEFLTWLENLK